jgi:large subunit ribosomal protein L24e
MWVSVPLQEESPTDELDCLLQKKAQKKRTRCAVKFQQAIIGASLADIMAKRNRKPQVRKAQGEQAMRAAKEPKKS